MWFCYLLLDWVKVAMSLCVLVAYIIIPACIDYVHWL